MTKAAALPWCVLHNDLTLISAAHAGCEVVLGHNAALWLAADVVPAMTFYRVNFVV